MDSKKKKPIRKEILLSAYLAEKAQMCADKKGITLSEYIKDSLKFSVEKDLNNNDK